MRFQRTDEDKPAVTTWSAMGLADRDGDGHIEVILEEDAYEDHWLEVDSIQDGSSHTIFPVSAITGRGQQSRTATRANR
ncbi:MAG: hypothetical protein WCA20_26615 [Candidatus Sulfotelmatobacter sp.]